MIPTLVWGVIVMGILLGGCLTKDDAGPRDYIIAFDINVPKRERDAVILALQTWQKAVPCPFSFTIAPMDGVFGEIHYVKREPPPIYSLDSEPTVSDTIQVSISNNLENTGGTTILKKGAVRTYFHANIPDNTPLIGVMLHEMGHALGLEHDDVDNGVMRSDRYRADLQQSDIDQYIKKWCS